MATLIFILKGHDMNAVIVMCIFLCISLGAIFIVVWRLLGFHLLNSAKNLTTNAYLKKTEHRVSPDRGSCFINCAERCKLGVPQFERGRYNNCEDVDANCLHRHFKVYLRWTSSEKGFRDEEKEDSYWSKRNRLILTEKC